MKTAKKLPPSWNKFLNKEPIKQLSFEESLFAEEKREALFIAEYLEAVKNAKFLRYRSQWSRFNRLEKINIYLYLDNVLEASSVLLYKISRRSLKYKHKTLEDFMTEIFVNKIDWPPTEEVSRAVFLEHHDNVSSKINGMFLAYIDVLKGNKALAKKIQDNLHLSHITAQRLNVI